MRKTRDRRRRVGAGATGMLVLAWLVFPLSALGLADLGDTPLDPLADSVTTAGENTAPSVEGTLEDPVGTVGGIVEDPVGAVEGTVDSVLNPSPAPQPPAEGSDNETKEGEGASNENDPQPTGSGNTASDTTSDSKDAGPFTESEQGPAQPTTSESAPSQSASGDPSPYVSYRPGATKYVPYPADYRPSPGSRSTLSIIKLLQQKKASPKTIARILAPFPVAGFASYSDDWGAARYVPEFHPHEGVDVFAESGTPVIACAAGVVSNMASRSAVGGTSLRVTASDGTYCYYAHLDRFAPRLAEGMSVSEGDVLGFVGSSGNAEGGQPHLHFEIHPRGGAAVPPVPYLDRWLAEATYAARAFKAQSTGLRQLVNVPAKAVAIASRAIGGSLASAQQGVSTSDLATWLVVFSVPVGLWLKKRRRRGRPSLLGASWLETGLPFASNPIRPG